MVTFLCVITFSHIWAGMVKKNIQTCLNKHIFIPNMWQDVLWFDENNVEVYGYYSKSICLQEKKHVSTQLLLPMCAIPREKHGIGSIILWVCFSSVGTVALVRIEGIMPSLIYHLDFTQNQQASVRQLKMKISPFSMIMTESTNPSQWRMASGEEQQHGMSQMKPRSQSYGMTRRHVGWLKEGCAQDLSLQFDKSGTFFQRRVG